jgi:hypothetical protein
MSKPATKPPSGVAKRSPKKSTKVAKKAAAKRVPPNTSKPHSTASKSQSRKASQPALLAGGNPQIAKADGDAPVQAYIAAMPSWKRDVGRASTRSSCAPFPACARQSNGTRPSMASRARAGSSAFIASRSGVICFAWG